MQEILKRMGIDSDAFKLAYLFGKEQGRKFAKGALIFPGIRVADLEKAASRSGGSAAELVAKRDSMLDSMIAFLEELAGLDAD